MTPLGGSTEPARRRSTTTVEGTMQEQQEQVLNLERVRELETWLLATNTRLIQVNGQRKYGGPPEGWDGPSPGARCEVFISHIPRDVYEDQLIPLFSSVGPLWEFRLMMNFSGQNRGFAYAKYPLSFLASAAIRLLNGYPLQPGSHLCVRHSVEKRHLCIGDLPPATQQGELLEVLSSLVEGVQRLSLKAGPGIKGVTAVVVFSTHHAASMAKKTLPEAFKKQFGLSVSIKWLSFPKSSSCEEETQRQPQHQSPPSLPPGPSGFCRAVGGPARPCRSLCQALGPRPGPGPGPTDGLIHVTYSVAVPGFNSTVDGVVKVLPGPTPADTLEEAQQAAAQQILFRIQKRPQNPALTSTR